MTQRHIVIVGGGIIGTSILYYLAKAQLESQSAPLHLTLLEESEELAPAASGKSGGFLAKDWHGSDTADLGRLSYELHEQLAKEDGGETKWHFREVETLSLKYDSSKKAKLSSKSSVPSWLDVKHVTQSSNMGGNHTTAQVTPKNLVEHLVSKSKEFATKLGDDKLKVDVRLGCRAEEVIMENEKVKQIKISKANDSRTEILDLDDVVVAAGPWTGSLLATLLPSALVNSPPKSLSFLKPSSRISGSRAHSIVLKSSSPTTAHCLFTDMHYSDDQGESRAGAPEIYARSDGTVYICGGSDSVKLPKNADEVGHDVKQIEKLKEQSKAISPETLGQDAEVVKEQACYLPISSSTGSPILAGDKNTGIYVSAGHSCWGITLSLGTGLCMSELILNGKVKSADVDDLMG